ncbi:hypothetical protein CCMA1212_002609 [Trichoderma ghanense]|uniref:Uncharacterized protein n=1 Tax=Trichoderma ghanense TaxID=65468 RepID=A0ABY2HCT2_9HYPO
MRGNARDDEREGLIDGLDPGQRLGRSLQYALQYERTDQQMATTIHVEEAALNCQLRLWNVASETAVRTEEASLIWPSANAGLARVDSA